MDACQNHPIAWSVNYASQLIQVNYLYLLGLFIKII